MRRHTCAILALVATLTGCMEPAGLRRAPQDRDRSLVLFAVLDPDEGAASRPGGQDVGVTSSFVPDTGEVMPAFYGVSAVLSSPDTAPVQGETNGSCYPSNLAGAFTCLRFHTSVYPGQTYTVTVSANEYPTAMATTTIPGDFRILDYEAKGLPPGTNGLRVSWTSSVGAYRYLVALRSEETPTCYPDCWNGWSVITDSMSFAGTVPTVALSKGTGPWHLDVYALDKHLFEYLSTGTGGHLFSVAHVSNVENGYGVVGSWVRRSVAVP